MVDVIFNEHFKRIFKKIKDESLKEEIIIQISKLKNQPTLGKPMRYTRKGTRELYVSPYRLSYKVEGDCIYIIDLYHKDEQ